MIFLGKPIFIWFGILSGLSVLAALVTGLVHAKLQTHKLFAFLAVVFFILHVLGVLGVY